MRASSPLACEGGPLPAIRGGLRLPRSPGSREGRDVVPVWALWALPAAECGLRSVGAVQPRGEDCPAPLNCPRASVLTQGLSPGCLFRGSVSDGDRAARQCPAEVTAQPSEPGALATAC